MKNSEKNDSDVSQRHKCKSPTGLKLIKLPPVVYTGRLYLSVVLFLCHSAR